MPCRFRHRREERVPGRIREGRGRQRVHADHDGEGQIMKWRKLGHVYAPDGSLPWARCYAANPVAEHVEGDIFRIYFSSRDEKNRSSIGSVEIDIRNPSRVLRAAADPVLAPGALA